MGGLMENYRLSRNYVFANFGSVLSELINTIRQWVNWLPLAPWFTVPAIAKDLLLIWMRGAAVTIRGLEGYVGTDGWIQLPKRNIGTFLYHIFLWPLIVWKSVERHTFLVRHRKQMIKDAAVETDEERKRWLEVQIKRAERHIPINRELLFRYLNAALQVFLGAGIFYLIAYVFSRLGL